MLHLFFFFNDTATTEIYTLSLHDALPIYRIMGIKEPSNCWTMRVGHASRVLREWMTSALGTHRSEEHTSELQSRQYLVCRLLLEKKKKCEFGCRRGFNVNPIVIR